ncbi:MAG: RNA polymerase sigma factor [bacterium]
MDNSNIVEGDNAAIRRYLESEDVAYLGKLYETHKNIIFFHCLKMIGNKEDAKDLASETFIRAFKNMDRFEIGSPFSPWLCRIATNLCIDFLRKKSRYTYQPYEENTLFESQEKDAGKEQYSEDSQNILAAIRMLKPVQRRCFCLFYVHDLSYKAISELTGYSPSEVRSYIQNGRRNFKLFMEKDESL